MTLSDARKTWSDDDLLALPTDGRKREIVHGEMVMMSPAGFDHGEIIGLLFGELAHYVHSRRLGRVLDPQTGFRLASGDLYCPDLAYISSPRVAEQRARKSAFFIGAPDLFVEVLSPDDTVENLQEKLDQFFREGCKLAWIINPRKKCAYVYRSSQSFRQLELNETLGGEEVVPGFAIELSFLFQ